MTRKLVYITGGMLTGVILAALLMVVFADDIYEATRGNAHWIPTVLLDDDNAMRELSRRGKIVPAENIVVNIEHKYQGRVVDLDFDRGLLRDIYEIELVDQAGARWDMEIDARTGEMLGKWRDWD